MFLFGSFSCSQEKSQENLLARVNDHAITLDDFRLFYEFDPNFGMDSTGIDALRDQLDVYIDRFLSMKKAESEHLWEDPVFVHAYQWEKRQAMLRQLYREVVEQSVVITEEETRQEFLDLNVEVNVRHLFTENEVKARELYQRLKNGERFEILAEQIFQDTVLSKNGGNLGWLRLNEFDEDLSDAIRKLQVGRVSNPIPSRWGYHIIEVLNRRENVIVVEDDYYQQKQKLFKRIKNRKSKKIASEYISNYVGGLNPQLNENSFRVMLNSAYSM